VLLGIRAFRYMRFSVEALLGIGAFGYTRLWVVTPNGSVVSVDRHQQLSISLHTSAVVCNEMGNFLWQSTKTTD
jgi:hypothetical protein